MKAGQLVTWATVCLMPSKCFKLSPSVEEELAHYVTKRPTDYDDHTNASSVERMIRADLMKTIDEWNLAPETPVRIPRELKGPVFFNIFFLILSGLSIDIT